MKNLFIYLQSIVIFLFIFLICLYNTTHSQSDCIEDLISYWKFDETGTVDTFIDSINGYNASCFSDCPTIARGIVSWGRTFDSSKVNLPAVNIFNWDSNGSFSIEYWMRRDSIGLTENEVIIGRDNPGTSGPNDLHWWVGINASGNPQFTLRDNYREGIGITGILTVTDNLWHQIVAVRDGTNNLNFLYVDGELKAGVSITYNHDFSANDIPINIGWLNGAFYYKGLLDEVAIYSTALTQSEIDQHYNNVLSGLGYCSQSTNVNENNTVPNTYYLYQNYPNPFNPSTKIEFQIANTEFVSLKVYDVLGNEVATIIDEVKPAGFYQTEFNTALGGNLSSGIYFYKLQAGNYIQNKKMILLQ